MSLPVFMSKKLVLQLKFHNFCAHFSKQLLVGSEIELGVVFLIHKATDVELEGFSLILNVKDFTGQTNHVVVTEFPGQNFTTKLWFGN